MSERPRVRTAEGVLEGRWRRGLAEFRGVPYAEPPVGALRFAAPVPVRRWEGVRPAVEFGPTPPQSGPVRTRTDGGTDWLTLNVCTPDPGAAGLPVLVWIPGGGYLTADTSDPMYDPAALAAAGLVVVSLAYRVGAEGFAQLDGAPANRGFLDQIAALRWVRRNIAAFGGDPGRVTVAGQSAGAGSVAALLTMESVPTEEPVRAMDPARAVEPEWGMEPEWVMEPARDLFQRAIAHSVPGTHLTRALAERIARALADRLGVAPTAAGLAGVDPWRLAGEVTALGAELPGPYGEWGRLARTGVAVGPVVDGEVLPESPWAALAGGRARGVELLVGHTRDEFRLFSVMSGRAGTFTEEEARTALELFAPRPEGAAAYRAAFPGAAPGELLETVYSDALFRMPSLCLARANEAAGGTSYLFELGLAATGFGGALGACHSLDVPLAFGTLDSPNGVGLLGEDPTAAARAVSRELRDAWVGFATSGDPGWPAARPDGAWLTRVLDAASGTLPYPERASVRIWEDHYPTPFGLGE
ncbi:carboxylesterase/lipase family protein [Streptomyces huiliensis]|uniref:carboxylesterase/lipase family protein n=1 Tax=Streptomyces huiliensis TaxID=2876027 RepID=UPI001CC0B1B6|nr:carboxylesterase family protein [Streptomyces huiliensis]MBZ4322515.1 carboxylesterase family protein [Streptomyces huiliensis]